MTIPPKKLFTTLFVLSFLIVSTAVPAIAASATTTHPIEYQIGVCPEVVNDGASLQYFKSQGFSTVQLVARNQGTYQAELNKIKSMGMKAILDIETPIWGAGKYRTTPIASYANYFKSLKAAGWEYVASEGGRDGDVAYISQFFKYVNYNCDQCGLWHASTGYLFHKQPGTVMNSWESYYTQEWPYIKQGAKEAAALGKQNGILAGVWGGAANPIRQNSLTGGSPSYKEMFDWSYANGCGFTHFHVWFSLRTDAVAAYKQWGFDQIVSQLQKTYPATNTAAQAALSVKPTPTPSPKVTPKPVQQAVAKAPTATPVKASATPSVVKATATPTKKATATPSPQVAQLASVTTNTTNATVPDVVVPVAQSSAQTSSVASLPPQPVLEFSLIGLGIPALVVGAIYLLMRKQ